MNELKKIFVLQDYGVVKFKFKEIMDQRGIKRNTLARAINTRFEVVNHYYQGNIEKLDVDILARICQALDCQICDVMEFEKVENPPSDAIPSSDLF